MAEDEKNNEQQEEKAEEKAPEAEAEETPEAEAEEAPEAEAEEAPEAEAEEAPAEEAPADEAAGADDEGLDWKAKRRLERSRQSGDAGPQRSPEERAAERAEDRRTSARRRTAYRPRGRTRRKGEGDGTPPADRDAVARKVRQGTVVSNKADKTITVRIDIVRRHPTYEKIVRRSSTLHAHDERNEAAEGDVVRLVETRPLSRTKRWRLAEILEKAK